MQKTAVNSYRHSPGNSQLGRSQIFLPTKHIPQEALNWPDGAARKGPAAGPDLSRDVLKTMPKPLLAAALSEAANRSSGASAARNRKLPARRTQCCCEMPKAPTQWQPRKGRPLAASVRAQVATALQSRPRSRQCPRKRWRVLFGRDQKLPSVQEEPEPRLPSHRNLQLRLPSQQCWRDLKPETVPPAAREPRIGNRRPLA